MSNFHGKHVPPSIGSDSFNCPHCGAYAHQFWFSVFAIETRSFLVRSKAAKISPYHEITLEKPNPDHIQNYHSIDKLHISICYSCRKSTVWIRDRLVDPARNSVHPANLDLPDDARADYDEAASILEKSPRGAAALLRICIQKLCKHLGQKGDNLHNDIGELVKEGLSTQIQQALDIVRVVGNNAVHPGQIDLSDDRKTAESLFTLVNLIVDGTISQPKRLQEMHSSLPDGALQAIERRDAGKRAPEK